MTEAVYRSNHPEVMSAWSKLQDEMKAYREREKALIKKLKPKDGTRRRRRPMHQRRAFSTVPVFVSFEVLPGDTTNPPEGWKVRKVKGRHSLYQDVLDPDKKTKLGKEIAFQITELDRSCPPDPRTMGSTIPGVRQSFMGPLPGLAQYGEYLYMHFDDEPSGKIDKRWERCKMSEYWAMREADESA